MLDRSEWPPLVPYLEHAHRIDPKFVPALINLGIALLDTRQREKALDLFTQALKLKPEEPAVHLDLMRACLALGNEKAARDEYAVLLELDPSRPHALPCACSVVW